MAQILIVEDDNDINQAVTKFLTQQGAQIRQEYSGTEGIRICLFWTNPSTVWIRKVFPIYGI